MAKKAVHSRALVLLFSQVRNESSPLAPGNLFIALPYRYADQKNQLKAMEDTAIDAEKEAKRITRFGFRAAGDTASPSNELMARVSMLPKYCVNRQFINSPMKH